MQVCSREPFLPFLPFLAILINSPSLLAHYLLSCYCADVQDLLAGNAVCKAAFEVLILAPTFDARAAHQLFALCQGHQKAADAFVLLICERAPVQEILPALLVAYQAASQPIKTWPQQRRF